MNYPEFIESSACNAMPSFHILDPDVTLTQKSVSYNGSDHNSQIQLDLPHVFHEVVDKIIRSTYQQVEFGHGMRSGLNPMELEIPISTITLASMGEEIVSLVCDYFTFDHMHPLSPSGIRQDQSNSFNTDEKQHEFFSTVEEASRHEEIFSVLNQAQCFKIVKQLKFLNDLTDEDPDELPMDFESLKMLAVFFVRYGKYLPEPAIGISSYELLQAEWHCKRSSAVMKFLPDGTILYAGVLEDKDNPKTIQDTAPPHLALENIREYISL